MEVNHGEERIQSQAREQGYLAAFLDRSHEGIVGEGGGKLPWARSALVVLAKPLELGCPLWVRAPVYRSSSQILSSMMQKSSVVRS